MDETLDETQAYQVGVKQRHLTPEELEAGLKDVARSIARARAMLDKGEKHYGTAVARDAAEKLSALVG